MLRFCRYVLRPPLASVPLSLALSKILKLQACGIGCGRRVTALIAKRIAVSFRLLSCLLKARAWEQCLTQGRSTLTFVKSCIVYKQLELTQQHRGMYRNPGCNPKLKEPGDRQTNAIQPKDRR